MELDEFKIVLGPYLTSIIMAFIVLVFEISGNFVLNKQDKIKLVYKLPSNKPVPIVKITQYREPADIVNIKRRGAIHGQNNSFEA